MAVNTKCVAMSVLVPELSYGKTEASLQFPRINEQVGTKIGMWSSRSLEFNERKEIEDGEMAFYDTAGFSM